MLTLLLDSKNTEKHKGYNGTFKAKKDNVLLQSSKQEIKFCIMVYFWLVSQFIFLSITTPRTSGHDYKQHTLEIYK